MRVRCAPPCRPVFFAKEPAQREQSQNACLVMQVFWWFDFRMIKSVGQAFGFRFCPFFSRFNGKRSSTNRTTRKSAGWQASVQDLESFGKCPLRTERQSAFKLRPHIVSHNDQWGSSMAIGEAARSTQKKNKKEMQQSFFMWRAGSLLI